jgi:hypothetical protein
VLQNVMMAPKQSVNKANRTFYIYYLPFKKLINNSGAKHKEKS